MSFYYAEKILLLIYYFFGVSYAQASDLPAFVNTQHQATLRAYLNTHINYALAPESLCACSEDLVKLRREAVDFQPYYAVGDINDDQIEDFAVALLDISRKADQKPELAVVIFHGPFLPGSANKGVVVIKRFQVGRPKEVLSVFKARVENNIRIPARLDIGPGIFGSDDVQTIFYNRKLKKYSVKYFYDE